MIAFSNVTYTRDGTPVFEDLSVDMLSGSFTLLVGANGSGKTSFLDLCSGIAQPDAGSVRVQGHSTISDTNAVRTEIGRVFEQPRDQLIGETVYADVAFGPENLGYALEDIDRRVVEALRAVGMEEHADTSIHRLSGGEAARVAIAGALAMEPAYLLLDEPTAGIDHPGRMQILDHLASLHRDGVGIILATHDLRDLDAVIDRLLVLGDRGIVADTTPSEVGDAKPPGVRIPASWFS